MLMPKRVKYRKAQRGRMRGKAQRGSTLAFGDFGLKALQPGWVTNRQIEAARVSLARSVKRGGKIFIRIFPDKPVTKKPAETRMGKGKGNPEFWVAVVKPGRIMYEMEGVDEATAKEGFRLAAQKIGIKTKFVTRVGVIERVFRHPRYQRVITRSKRLKAHDEQNASKVGDRVLVEETRPLSKEKRWRILQVLASAS